MAKELDLWINGVLAPLGKTKYKVGHMDITKAERNILGTMIIEIIAVKAKIELEWYLLSSSELSKLFGLIKPAQFPVKYFDPEIGDYTTKTFYKGDRSTGIVAFNNGEPYWKGSKFNLIEI